MGVEGSREGGRREADAEKGENEWGSGSSEGTSKSPPPASFIFVFFFSSLYFGTISVLLTQIKLQLLSK